MDIPPLKLQIDGDTLLRQTGEQDAAALFALIERNRARLRVWLPWLDTTRTVEDELSFLRYSQQQYNRGLSINCVLVHKGEIAGNIGYNTLDWQNRKTEIGYWIAQGYEGKGLMSGACRELLNFAFGILELNKVEIRCAVGNMRSCAIPRRLGFTHEGVSRQAEWLYDHYVDLELYGLLASEWRR